MSLIEIKNISKVFNDNPAQHLKVLEHINLKIEANDFLMLLGPSGSGKSTLLRIICGLESASSGEVVFREGITRHDFAFVFQEFGLFPWLTVYQNIELPLLSQNIDSITRVKRVKEEIIRLGLEHFTHTHPHELSGGMKQRVGIARALAVHPKIIFLDEPFSELDSFTAQELRLELINIWSQTKCTIIMVTHLVPEAIALGSRIAILTARPGKIEKIIDNTLARPRRERSQDFFDTEDALYKLIKP